MAEAKAYKMIPHCTMDTITYEMDELVRCKNCIKAEVLSDHVICRNERNTECQIYPFDFFCADGERKV